MLPHKNDAFLFVCFYLFILAGSQELYMSLGEDTFGTVYSVKLRHSVLRPSSHYSHYNSQSTPIKTIFGTTLSRPRSRKYLESQKEFYFMSLGEDNFGTVYSVKLRHRVLRFALPFKLLSLNEAPKKFYFIS
jgi:hypothetical protein